MVIRALLVVIAAVACSSHPIFFDWVIPSCDDCDDGLWGLCSLFCVDVEVACDEEYEDTSTHITATEEARTTELGEATITSTATTTGAAKTAAGATTPAAATTAAGTTTPAAATTTATAATTAAETATPAAPTTPAAG